MVKRLFYLGGIGVNLPFLILKEMFSLSACNRAPEPDLVMDDPQSVRSYSEAGAESGVMAPTYLFHSAQMCQVFLQGETVVDLACGPCNQLVQLARLNPDVNFIGVDLSMEMLERAEKHIKSSEIKNITLKKVDITDLSLFSDSSIDAVISSMSLHHLPDQSSLSSVLSEIARILKKDGGVYLADFGRLKLESSMHFFANKDADIQPDLFTLDYFNSLKAAFMVKDFNEALTRFSKSKIKLDKTFLIPFLVFVHTPIRRDLDSSLYAEFSKMRLNLTKKQSNDLNDMLMFARMGGVKTPYLS